jgi:hypothetical protein
MPDNLNPTEPHTFDDDLARFADRVTGGEQPGVPEMDGEDRELAEMMHTIVRLERVIKADQPDPGMSNRIRANLLKEWERSSPAAGQSSFWQRAWSPRKGGFTSQQRQWAGLVVVIGAAILLIAIYPLVTPLEGVGSLPGSGGGALHIPPAVIVGGLVVLGGVAWWLGRSRR